MAESVNHLPTSTQAPLSTDDGVSAGLGADTQTEFELHFFAGILRRHPSNLDVIRAHSRNLAQLGMHLETLEIDRRWVRLTPNDPLAHYNLARTYALTSQFEQALDSLRNAIECGYRDFQSIRQENDLRDLRDDPRFAELLFEYGDL